MVADLYHRRHGRRCRFYEPALWKLPPSLDLFLSNIPCQSVSVFDNHQSGVLKEQSKCGESNKSLILKTKLHINIRLKIVQAKRFTMHLELLLAQVISIIAGYIVYPCHFMTWWCTYVMLILEVAQCIGPRSMQNMQLFYCHLYYTTQQNVVYNYDSHNCCWKGPRVS